MDKQCSYQVIYDSWCHTHQCGKKAVVERDGKAYCKVHDPEYVRAKDEARTAKYNRGRAEKRARWELEDTAINACKEINPDNPLAAAQSIKDLYEALEDIVEQAGKTKMMLPADLADSIRVFGQPALAKAKGAVNSRAKSPLASVSESLPGSAEKNKAGPSPAVNG